MLGCVQLIELEIIMIYGIAMKYNFALTHASTVSVDIKKSNNLTTISLMERIDR